MAGVALWDATEGSAVVRRVVAAPTVAAGLAGVNAATARVQYRRWLDEGRLAYDEAAGVYYLPEGGEGAEGSEPPAV